MATTRMPSGLGRAYSAMQQKGGQRLVPKVSPPPQLESGDLSRPPFFEPGAGGSRPVPRGPVYNAPPIGGWSPVTNRVSTPGLAVAPGYNPGAFYGPTRVRGFDTNMSRILGRIGSGVGMPLGGWAGQIGLGWLGKILGAGIGDSRFSGGAYGMGREGIQVGPADRSKFGGIGLDYGVPGGYAGYAGGGPDDRGGPGGVGAAADPDRGGFGGENY